MLGIWSKHQKNKLPTISCVDIDKYENKKVLPCIDFATINAVIIERDLYEDNTWKTVVSCKNEKANCFDQLWFDVSVEQHKELVKQFAEVVAKRNNIESSTKPDLKCYIGEYVKTHTDSGVIYEGILDQNITGHHAFTIKDSIDTTRVKHIFYPDAIVFCKINSGTLHIYLE